MDKKNLVKQPEVAKALQEYDLQELTRSNKIGCWLVIFGMPAGVTLDQNVYPSYVSYFLGVRLVSSILGLAVLGGWYTPIRLKYPRLLTLALPLIPLGSILWMIFTSEGASSPYYAGLNLVLVGMCLLVPWNFLEILGISLGTLIFYVLACLKHGPILNNGIFYNNLYFLALTAIIAVVGTYFTGQLRLREFISRYELDQNRRKLAETNQKLVELDQMKTRFFANISHELRTPLTLLISPLETLQREKSHLFDGEMTVTFQTMQQNAMRLLKLINDLLDLVKLESGRMELRKEIVRLPEFLKGLALSVQGTAKDKKVQLTCSVNEEMGSILADRDKLEKILLNLLFNSVKFTPAGGKVDLSAREEMNRLVLKVTDTGMGIAEENLPHVFDRFWQADSSAQRKYQGTGIGLSLVKELAELHGGKVKVESQLGKGTTMTVEIPLEKTGSLPAESVPETKVSSGVETASSQEWQEKLYRRAELFPSMTPLSATLRPEEIGGGRRPKVLVADDEPDMLRFLKTQMEKHYEVLEAVDGRQAVEKARQFLPDLVLLDMMMPEMDGIEACRILKGTISTQALPVILLTARADDETKMAALAAGASDFLTKPFSGTELHVRVKNLVESHRFQLDLARQKTALESALEQLKETEGQLVQNEKMASLGRLSAGIIHEINNPLNYATQALYLLKTRKDRLPEGDREKYVEIVSDIEEGVGRVQRIVSDLRTFSHPHVGGGRDLIEVEEVVSTALRFFSHEMKDQVKVEVDVPKDEQVLADRNKLVHVLVNLFQNAVDALKEKKSAGETPQILIRSRRENGRVLLGVRDNGTGINPENLDKIFDPFFTTKDVGEGMGLGLSICYRIMREQGGGISVKSEKGKFTEFILELQVRETAAEKA